MVGIDADFSDVDQFFEDGTSEVVAGMKEEGEAFVEDAKATGNYHCLLYTSDAADEL